MTHARRRTGGPARLGSVLGAALHDLLLVLVPVDCAGCGRVDVALCPACLLALSGATRRCELDAARLVTHAGESIVPVWTRAAYDGPVREAVLGWKARGRVDLQPILARQLIGAFRELAPIFAKAVDPGLCGPSTDRERAARDVECEQTPLWIVPMPSTRAAVRRRAGDLVARLAAEVAGALTAQGLPARGERWLVRRGGRHQAGLSRTARAANRSRPLRALPALRRVPIGAPVVLLDDIVTTGATLAQAHAYLTGRGMRVIGAVVIAATPRPAPTTGRSGKRGLVWDVKVHCDPEVLGHA